MGLSIPDWYRSLSGSAEQPEAVILAVTELLGPALESTYKEVEEHAEWMGDVTSGLVRVLETNYWMHLSQIQRLRLTLAAGLLTDLLTQSPLVAVTISTAVALWENIRRLNDQELELILTMRDITRGKIYSRWVETEEIIRSLPPDDGRSHYLDLLASLKSKSVLEESAGRWRAIR